MSSGDDRLSWEIRARARALGAAVVFLLGDLRQARAEAFATVDGVIAPSAFAADQYRKALGRGCTVLPRLVDLDRVRAAEREPRYITFVDPTYGNGVFAFARIADELGRRRPDIALLLVEGNGSERTLADCGLDLRAHGNVSLTGRSSNPRRFWSVTKACLLPSLRWESQPLTAIEAIVNGVPVIGSDRGGIPETLGSSGVILPLPERLTHSTRMLPTRGEVAPWVEAIIRLWDDAGWSVELGRRASWEARRWAPDVLEPQYARFFTEVRASDHPMIEAGGARSDFGSAPNEQKGSQATTGLPCPPSIEDGVAAIARRWPNLKNDCGDEPIFVLAAGWRSGSTMLQRLIVRSCFLWGEPFGHSGMIDALAGPLRCFNDHWPEAQHFHTGSDPETLSRCFIANLYPSIPALLRAHQQFFMALFAQPARRAGASRWGLKEVRLSVDHAIYLKWVFPRAKFLFLIRNPYDAWRSYAARAARGWQWYNRWPDEPVTVVSFAEHWRRLVTCFLEDHHKVDGLVVRYDDLKWGEYAGIEKYLGFALSQDAARLNPSDGGPPPLDELPEPDREVLETRLGALAGTLGYGQHPG